MGDAPRVTDTSQLRTPALVAYRSVLERNAQTMLRRAASRRLSVLAAAVDPNCWDLRSSLAALARAWR